MPELAPIASESINQQLAILRASGMSLREIEPIVGIDHTSVSKRANQPHVRKLIEELSAKFAAENASKILSIQSNAVSASLDTWQDINSLKSSGLKQEAAEFATTNKDLLDAADKIVKRAAQSMGLNPSPAPSVFLQAVFNGPSHIILGDAMAQMLGQAARQLTTPDDPDDGDIIDLE
jgi:hypothetical protein